MYHQDIVQVDSLDISQVYLEFLEYSIRLCLQTQLQLVCRRQLVQLSR